MNRFHEKSVVQAARESRLALHVFAGKPAFIRRAEASFRVFFPWILKIFRSFWPPRKNASFMCVFAKKNGALFFPEHSVFVSRRLIFHFRRIGTRWEKIADFISFQINSHQSVVLCFRPFFWIYDFGFFRTKEFGKFRVFMLVCVYVCMCVLLQDASLFSSPFGISGHKMKKERPLGTRMYSQP